jgi:type I restriction enzyme, S subunit
LSYFFGLPSFKEHIRAIAVGATMPSLNTRLLSDVLIPYPSDTRVQRAIAHILGTLDDKIELNRRMNETLEAIARAIFKSWFVDFDPVRAKAEGREYPLEAETLALFPDGFEESELGEIPAGWEVTKLSEVVKINPVRSLAKNELAPYLPMSEMPTDTAFPSSWSMREYKSGMRFKNEDVLFARITPCLENGKTAYVNSLNDHEIGWGSTEYLVFRSKPPLPSEYAYFLARTEHLRAYAIANMTGTSGRQRVSPKLR